MTESIYWIGIDFEDGVPSGEQMENIVDSISDGIEHHAILTTTEIDPMSREEREKYVEELVEALENS